MTKEGLEKIAMPSKYYLMVTDTCNCRCEYCYHSPSQESMGTEILKASIEQILGLAENPMFLWYGGEPMLAGQEFYEKIIEFQNDKNCRNLIQTNLTIDDPAFLKFLLKNKFTISTSIDGPQRIHDQNRRYSLSSGSPFEDTMENVSLLKTLGQTPWAICVISKSNVNVPDEIYEFFNQKGINVRFCPEIANMDRITSEQYIPFIREVHELWRLPTNRIKISNFSKAAETIRIKRPVECDNMKNCLQDNLGIATNGDVYPCNRFVGREDFKLGNMLNGLEAVFNSEKYLELSQRSKLLCGDSRYSPYSHGGCMFNALVQSGDWRQIDEFVPASEFIISLFNRGGSR